MQTKASATPLAALLATAAALALILAGQGRAAITVTGSVTPIYNGTSDPWVLPYDPPWISGQLRVGAITHGWLTITNGSVVSSEFLALIGNGAARGTVNVAGNGSTLEADTRINVGHTGSGTLTTSAGGSVKSADIVVGANTGSSGTATVTGSGSTWDAMSLTVGHSGTGVLLIEDGGTVTSAGVDIGDAGGSTGEVTVRGTGSHWQSSSHVSFNVGRFGTGTLLIKDEGTVTSTHGYIGSGSGSNGEVTVTGANSLWQNTVLTVGGFGTGTLLIEDGGGVTNTVGSIIRSYGGSTGEVTVRGTGSLWQNSGPLVVGTSYVDVAGALGGTGTLLIEAGGTVTNTNGYIGEYRLSSDEYGGSTDEATVTGVGSTWTNTGDLILGGSSLTDATTAVGFLNVNNGGKVEIGGTLRIHGSSTVHLQPGGTIKTHSLDPTGGGSFQWTGGTLHADIVDGSLTNSGGTLAPGRPAPNSSNGVASSTVILGNYTQQTGATLEIEIGGTSPGGTHDLVNIGGTATFQGGELQLALLGGFIPAPSDTFTVLNAAGGGIFGVFSNITSGLRLETSDGLGSFLVHYGVGSAFNQNQVVLSAFELAGPGGLLGDFDLDGDVDGVDFLVWQRGESPNPGSVGDLADWQASYGISESLPTKSIAIPEPASGALVALLIPLVAGCRQAARSATGARRG